MDKKKTAIKYVFVICTVALLLGTLKAAQQDAVSKPAEVKYTEIRYSADTTSYRWDGEDRILLLSGNVKFIQGDTTFLADKIDYREKTKTAQASGNLKIFDERNVLTADLCAVNFDEKKATLTGNVHLVAKPKPTPDSKPADGSTSTKSLRAEWKDEAVVTCDKAEYYYKEKKAILSGNFKIVQKTRTITADSAVYLGNDEKVELVGNVNGVDEKDKHSFSAPRVVISLKEDDEWIEAEKATGKFYIKEKESSAAPPAK